MTAIVQNKTVVAATVQEVHDALVDPTKIAAWWNAWAGCSITKIEMDARAGGDYRIDSRDGEGEEHFITGKFLSIGASLIAATWRTDLSKHVASHVFIRLQAVDDQNTEVSIEHRDVVINWERAVIAKGWRMILAVMQRGIPRQRSGGSDPAVESYLEEHPECR